VTSSIHSCRLRRPSSLRALRFGDCAVTYIPDGVVQMHPRTWFTDSSDEDWSNRRKYLDDEGFLVGSIGGLLVQREGRALLVDAGYGPHRVPAELSHPALGRLEGGTLLEGLGRIGVAPEDIEVLALTHFHDDHVGWAPALAGNVLVSKNATVVATPEEWDSPGNARMAAIPADRRVRAVNGQEIFPGVTVRLTPGHTTGHSAYVISAGERRLIAFGDAIHTPAQISAPQWRSVFDYDHDMAVRSRKSLIADLAEPGSLGYGVHFADAVFGRVRGEGGDKVWEPVDEL
jgi:glyoxylase-like metal-dependent hydrolase (beta-lactamase superfamily II)